VGDDVLSEAYFTGNVDKLQGAYEAAKGKGSWDKLINDFGTRLGKDTSY